MATIYCSNKMGKWLGKVQSIPDGKDYFNSWNANLFKIDRKNWLICVHNPTAYSLIFPEIKKADMKSFELWFYPRLSEQFLYDRIETELAGKFPSSSMAYFRTNNHSRTIGVMNYQVQNLKWGFPYRGGVANVSLVEVNHRFNTIPIGSSPHIWPIEEMKGFLEDIS